MYRLFDAYPRYDWTDHPRKWYWTARIIISLLIIGAAALLIARSDVWGTDTLIYMAVVLITLIRLPKKFSRRKMYKNAIKSLKEREKEFEEAYRREEEFRQQYQESHQEQRTYEQAQGENGFNFFSSCVTKEDVEATYKKLAMIYHPDQNAGDADIFKKIQAEYTEAIRKYA